MVSDVPTLGSFGEVIGRVLEKALPFLGLATGLMFLVGGFQLITAGGEKEGLQKAKNTITYAVFGLILVFLGWFALLFIEHITGVQVTKFKIGG
ncbi:hypothetical protein J7J95_01090 [bacterium]|nr:hypothetical protein [bacterium]